MKKIICWLLLALLLVGCVQMPKVEKVDEETTVPAETAVQIPNVGGYEDFMATLSAAIVDGKDNKNLSPISVYIAFAMAAEGAQGRTREEMLTLLGAKDIEDLRKNVELFLQELDVKGEDSEIFLADSFWLGEQDGAVTFHEAYLKTLSDSYDAEAYAVRFGKAETSERIKAWIKEKTRDKIEPSADAMQFDPSTIAVLINTIYLKDGWRMPFNANLTEEGVFYETEDRTRQVEYMHRKDMGVSIVKGNGYLRYALPLNELGTMVFVLPSEGTSLESLLGSPDKIKELLTGGEKVTVDVDVMMPKFSFQDRTDLVEIMKSLGVVTCFSPAADFSAMTDTRAYISRALQESYIGVDEKGVEAAAYTLIAMAKGGAMPVEREQVDFHLTRPFLYAIESRDGTVLFLGTVTAPTEIK